MSNFVIAECAIRQLHARFVDAVWRKDSDAFANCFAEDAEWKIAGMQIQGRAEIGRQFSNLMSKSERAMMFLGMPILEVAQTTATGRIYVTEYVKMLDGSAARTLGVYYDKYVGEGDQWRFQWRHWNCYYRGPADFSAPFISCPDYGPHPGMPAPDEAPPQPVKL